MIDLRCAEWYKATVVSVDADSGTYDVEYDDGELDTGLCRLCMRPYKPLEVDEEVECHDEEDDAWYKGRVVKVHGNDTFDIDTYKYGIYMQIPVSSTRRIDPEGEIEMGSRIEALYKGRGKKWFAGVVQAIHDDGTYDILYDDGDREFRVKRKHIRI